MESTNQYWQRCLHPEQQLSIWSSLGAVTHYVPPIDASADKMDLNFTYLCGRQMNSTTADIFLSDGENAIDDTEL